MPNEDTAYTNFAYFAQKSGKELEKGLKYALKATQLKPYKADNWRILAQVYFKLGQPEKALEAIERALRLKPHSAMYKRLKQQYSGK